jgi:hypothetical protein
VVKVETTQISQIQVKEKKIRVRSGINESEVRQIEGRQLRSD